MLPSGKQTKFLKIWNVYNLICWIPFIIVWFCFISLQVVYHERRPGGDHSCHLWSRKGKWAGIIANSFFFFIFRNMNLLNCASYTINVMFRNCIQSNVWLSKHVLLVNMHQLYHRHKCSLFYVEKTQSKDFI